MELAGFVVKDSAKLRQRMDEACEAFLWIRDRLDEPAHGLSGGQRQMLTLGVCAAETSVARKCHSETSFSFF